MVCDRLAQGKQVRVSLPLGGRLHIDRPLPFLCVYRQPPKYQDPGTEQLVIGEAAHLIAAGDKQLKPSLSALVQAISQTMVEKFGAFLIIEVWAARQTRADNEPDGPVPKPAFRLITSKARPPTATIEGLTKALKRIKIQRRATAVDVVYSGKRSPAGLSPLILSTQANKANCFVIGLGVYALQG